MTDDQSRPLPDVPSADRGDTAVDALRKLKACRDGVDRLIEATVTRARADRWSWTQIGAALGISRQEAQARYYAEAITDRRPRVPSTSAAAAAQTARRQDSPLSTPFGSYRPRKTTPTSGPQHVT